jgi:diketogulonate reductase-like aldo/keto reductase
VPIPGSRKAERIAQNAAAGDVILSSAEIARIDIALDGMEFEVFGGNAAARK